MVADKYARVQRFQQAAVHSALEIMAAMGADGPEQLRPHMLRRRSAPHTVSSYAELYEWLEPGRLLEGGGLPGGWARDWEAARPDSFTV